MHDMIIHSNLDSDELTHIKDGVLQAGICDPGFAGVSNRRATWWIVSS